MKKIDFYKVIIILLVLLNMGTLIFMWLNKPELHPEENPASTPFKQVPGNDDKAAMQSSNDNLASDLQLNKEQTVKFIELKKKHHETEVRLHDSLRETKKMFFDQISERNAAAESYAQKIGSLEKARLMNTFNYFTDIRKLCNEQQKDKFDRIYRDALRQLNGPPRR